MPSAPAGLDRDRRHQEEAVLDARLSRLRKALNQWWTMSGSGKGLADRFAVLTALDEAAEQVQRIKRLRR